MVDFYKHGVLGFDKKWDIYIFKGNYLAVLVTSVFLCI